VGTADRLTQNHERVTATRSIVVRMSGIVSKWVVLEHFDVGADDLDASGAVRDDVVARWIDDVCAAYLACCPVLRDQAEASGCVLRRDVRTRPSGADFTAPASVNVSAGATEIWPTEFAVEVRFRSYGSGDDVACSASCRVSIVDPATGEARELGDAVRDELIALAHAARHFN
jgi:acyl-CoA thioesterase FadM